MFLIDQSVKKVEILTGVSPSVPKTRNPDSYSIIK